MTRSLGFVRSAAMQDAIRGLEAAIGGSGGVLLCGEPGSGRELFARAIHEAGQTIHHGDVESLLRRAMRGLPDGRPFVSIDCADRVSLEARLFGGGGPAEKGAAELDRVGEQSAIHAGAGGTLVLKQLPEMPLRMQARLARILRDGEVLVQSAGHAGGAPAHWHGRTERRRRAGPGSPEADLPGGHRGAAAPRAPRGHTGSRAAPRG
jgi:transcriptional regulator with AAA-type ATPase domain